MQADIKNRNGRVYPMEVLEKEVKRYNEEYVDKKRAFGELGHPEGPTVNLDKVSHMITKLEPKNGANYVKKDFYLATAADIVADPSAPNAFVEGIYEGKEWVWDNGSLIESELQRMKRRIDERVRKRQANENALEFAKYLKML